MLSAIIAGFSQQLDGLPGMNRKQRRLSARAGQMPGAPSLADARQFMRAGRLSEAHAICRRILSVAPKDGYALHLLGVIAGRAGDLQRALTLFGRAAAVLPREPAVQLDLGNALLALERYDEALRAFRHSLNLNSGLLPAHMGEGNALRALCRYEEAERAYRNVIALSPSMAAAYANLGLVLKELERNEEAIAAFKKAVSLDTGLAEAHSALGILLWRDGRIEDALSALRQALAVRPDYIDVHAIIGRLLMEQERGVEAEAPFRKLLSLCPNDPRAHEGLAQALDQQGRYADAEVHFRRAIESDGTRESLHRELIENLAKQNRLDDALDACGTALETGVRPAAVHAIGADLYMQQGMRDEAIETAKLAQSLDPDGMAGLWLLTRTQKLSREDETFKRLVFLAERLDEISSESAVLLEFALGKAFQDVGDYDRAFQHLHGGNARKRETFRYDIERVEQTFRLVAESFDADFVNNMSGGGVSSDLPILIIGMPRSGTTLTEQVLASHPAVCGAGELKDLAVASGCLDDPDSPPITADKIPTVLSKDLCGEIGREYVELLHRRDPSAARVTDKMPFNFIRLGLVHLALPNCRIIHCVRDPVDTCLSCYQQLFKSGNRFAYDLSELGRYHVAYQKLMDHWRSVLPAGRIFEIRYEELVADFEQNARRLVDHCGLEWNDACLSFHKAERQVRTASVAQVRQPIYKSSVAKWRRYEKHLGPLLDALAIQ